MRSVTAITRVDCIYNVVVLATIVKKSIKPNLVCKSLCVALRDLCCPFDYFFTVTPSRESTPEARFVKKNCYAKEVGTVTNLLNNLIRTETQDFATHNHVQNTHPTRITSSYLGRRFIQ